MPTAEINNYVFDYTDDGVGDPIVCSHGAICDRRIWEGQRSALSNEFRIVAYSHRYHWPNQPVEEGVGVQMQEQVEDLEALIGELDLAPAHLMGNSSGAYICLMVAIRRPDLVRSLVLGEVGAFPLFMNIPPKPLDLPRLLFTKPRTGIPLIRFFATAFGPAMLAFKRGDRETASRRFLDGVLGSGGYAAMPKEQLQQVRDNNFPEQFQGSFMPVTDDQVRSVKTPTLLVDGARSPKFFARLNDRMEELLPNVERVAIPDASHCMQVDNPQAFNEAVALFLQKH